MNENNIHITIKDYFKKVKAKIELIDELNKQLEELKNKKEELIKNKNNLKEEKNKIVKKNTDKTIVNPLNNKNKNLPNSRIQSSKTIKVNLKTNIKNINFSAEKPKKGSVMSMLTNLRIKNNELEQTFKRYNTERLSLIQKIFETEKRCNIVVNKSINKANFLYKK